MPNRALSIIPTAFEAKTMSLTASATGYALVAVGSGTAIIAEATSAISFDPWTNRLTAATGLVVAMGGILAALRNSRAESKKLTEVLNQNAEQSAKLNILQRDMESATAQRDQAQREREAERVARVQADRKADELARKVDELRQGQTVITSKVDAARRILIVEDDTETARQLARFLILKGFDVHVAPTIGDARQVFTGRCAWIFVHRIVAGEDGLAYIREIKAKGLNIKLAMITGLPGDDVLEQADRAFVDLIVPKPIDLDRLLRDMFALEEKAPRPTLYDVERKP